MNRYWGVLTEDGVGDLIEGTKWRKTDGGCELFTIGGNWVRVFTVFKCDNLQTIY